MPSPPARRSGAPAGSSRAPRASPVRSPSPRGSSSSAGAGLAHAGPCHPFGDVDRVQLTCPCGGVAITDSSDAGEAHDAFRALRHDHASVSIVGGEHGEPPRLPLGHVEPVEGLFGQLTPVCPPPRLDVHLGDGPGVIDHRVAEQNATASLLRCAWMQQAERVPVDERLPRGLDDVLAHPDRGPLAFAVRQVDQHPHHRPGAVRVPESTRTRKSSSSI